jgi:predicted Rossmann-fold nucleotide-binding protein
MVRIIEHVGKHAKVKTLDLVSELKNDKRFRVAIFGSARVKPGDKVYKEVYHLAEMVGGEGYDVVTGGGPGLMEAANAGHAEGDKTGRAESIGLVIKLPWENRGNEFLEISHTYKHFSKRLDTFLALSNVMVVTKGGIGSLLELSYMWQHLQVHLVEYKPIILIGKMWEDFIKWMKTATLPENLVSPEDFDYIYIAKNNREAMAMINEFDALHRKEKVLRKIECKKDKCVIPKKPSKIKIVKVVEIDTSPKRLKNK